MKRPAAKSTFVDLLVDLVTESPSMSRPLAAS